MSQTEYAPRRRAGGLATAAGVATGQAIWVVATALGWRTLPSCSQGGRDAWR
jgi:threonine/homoserine/homoserine lactone efflux protein